MADRTSLLRATVWIKYAYAAHTFPIFANLFDQNQVA